MKGTRAKTIQQLKSELAAQSERWGRMRTTFEALGDECVELPTEMVSLLERRAASCETTVTPLDLAPGALRG